MSRTLIRVLRPLQPTLWRMSLQRTLVTLLNGRCIQLSPYMEPPRISVREILPKCSGECNRYTSTEIEAFIQEPEESSNQEATARFPLRKTTEVHKVKYTCSGCGSVLQSVNPKLRGFIPKEKLDRWQMLTSDPGKVLAEEDSLIVERVESNKTLHDDEDDTGEENCSRDEESYSSEDEDCGSKDDSDVEDYFPDSIDDTTKGGFHEVSSLVCKRCFYLKHYNDALNITLDKDDYLRHLAPLKNKQSLILLILDVADFPCCVFPNLSRLLSPHCSILIVVNKIDLFPKNLTNKFWSKFRSHIVEVCREKSIGDHKIVGVRFVSVKQGIGTTELSSELVEKWQRHGDIYLMGCTNVGKSSLFNKLLLHLCGSRPGELNTDSNLLAPMATISKWPGTTLGLLSFPLLSIGKRRRLINQQRKREEEIAQGIKKFDDYIEKDVFQTSIQPYEDDPRERDMADSTSHLIHVEVEDVLSELGLRRKKKEIVEADEAPQNKQWLHDTPGAINEAQLINYLTQKELTVALPKVPFKPRTFILRPGQCMFLGGLARLDYVQGSVSAFFTVFTWSYLNVHATKTENADMLYERHLGSADSVFKLPFSYEERGGATFPPLEQQDIVISGTGWKKSAADVVLSSAGWVSVTFGGEEDMILRAHTPMGKGVYVRPALFDEAVNLRGKRERYGNRTAFHGDRFCGKRRRK